MFEKCKLLFNYQDANLLNQFDLFFARNSHPLQAVARIKDDRRQNDVEENLRIEGRLEIDLIDVIADELTSKGVSVGSILDGGGVVEGAGKLQPEAVGRETLIVSRRLFSLDR